MMALFVAIISICSWISLQFVVPVTLQTFAIFLTCLLLGGKLGTITVLVYILIGAIGIPVFSGFSGGIGRLAGPTGGYILGFLLSALVIWFFTYVFGKKTWVLLLAMSIALIACYCVGTLWFMMVYIKNTGPITISAVLSMCVVPFIIPDIIKISLAFLLYRRLHRFTRL